jgi:hypothetical protein
MYCFLYKGLEYNYYCFYVTEGIKKLGGAPSLLVDPKGLEPLTSSTSMKRSSQLS